jgi:Response regulator containing a CheY-like receiver domain and an HTH DNA-binding domain
MAGKVPAGCPLSARQWAAARLVCEGASYRTAAKHMGCSVSNVRSHLHEAYKRLRVKTGAQMAVVVCASGWMDPVDIEWTDRRVTAAQYLYLQAFDRLAEAKGGLATIATARSEMSHMLRAMCIERGIEVPNRGKPHQKEGLRRLMDTLLGGSL